jgi:hypothetical protein
MSGDVCSWCGVDVGPNDGFRRPSRWASAALSSAGSSTSSRGSIQGAHWDAGTILQPGDPDDGLGRCAHCGGALDDRRVLLVRHRGEHRIADAFCGVDHLLAWAKAGGRGPAS